VAWLHLCGGVHWLVEAHLGDVFELWTVHALRGFGSMVDCEVVG
jgi:hypothetical protein